MLNYKSCTDELNSALNALLHNEPGANKLLNAWEDRCEKTLNWLLYYQIFGRNPIFTVYKGNYNIGGITYKGYIPTGKEYNDVPSIRSISEIVSNETGLAMGIVSLKVDDPVCTPTIEGVNNLKTGNCCIEFEKYLDENNNSYITQNYSDIKDIYNKSCTTCSLETPLAAKETIDSLPGNLCCDTLKKWLDIDDNKFSYPILYTEYDQAYINSCKTPGDDGDDGTGGNPSDPGAKVCNYSVLSSYPKTCTTSTTGYVSDITDWSCIFDSETLGGTNFKDMYKEMSNRYCNIYCRQDVNYEFPSSSLSFLAGTHFTINKEYGSLNSWNPVAMTETSTCQADEDKIDHDLFVSDWNQADKEVRDAWDDYQREVVRQTSIANEKMVSINDDSCDFKHYSNRIPACESSHLVYTCSSGIPNGTTCISTVSKESVSVSRPSGTCSLIGKLTGKCVKCSSGSLIDGACYLSCPAGYTTNGTSCDKTPTCPVGSTPNSSGTCDFVTPADSHYECDAGATNTTKYDKSTAANLSYTGWSSSGSVWNNNPPSWCGNSEPSTNPSSYKTIYYQKLSTRDNLLVELKSCSDFTYSHTFDPILKVSYEDSKYGGTFDLKGSSSVYTSTEKIANVTGTVSVYVCNEGSRCSYVTNSVTYPKNDNILHTSIKTVNYELADNIYNYIDKFSGISSSYVPSNQYATIAYSNLPIDFKTPSGSYNISLLYNDFGSSNKFNKFINTGLAGTEKCDGSPNCEYTCTYNVVNKILCNPAVEDCGSTTNLLGLNVIYRQVALSNPFPGIDGKGRTPGDNWVGYEKVITKNRGVNGDEIYTKKDPIYEITLDVETIKYLREYNSKTSYTDFTLICDTGTGKNCISPLLTELKNMQKLQIDSCARTNNKWNSTCN